MRERLIIKNFGPIKDVDLNLKRFNVLIGEQATGKSTIVKLLAACRYFSNLVGNNGKDKQAFEFGLYDWGLGSYWSIDTYIRYECEHYNLTIDTAIEDNTVYSYETNEPEPEIQSVPILLSKLEPKSKAFVNLLSELDKIKPENDPFLFGNLNNWVIPSSFYQNDVASVLDNPYFIYTERTLQSIFSIGKNSIANLSNSLFNYFDKTAFIQSSFYRNETDIEPLNVKYKNVNGQGFIKSDKHDFISLSDSATGFQSAIPIVLLMNYYSNIRKRKKTFIIEEPEINLFPSTQNKLIQFIADKTMNYENITYLTTHSPYVLTSINNLLYAHQVGQKNKASVIKIVPEIYWLNPNDVSAYRLLPNGTTKNIIDADLNEIIVEEIDEIGLKLNSDYDCLLGIKLEANDSIK